jgi:hypothetical protein
MTLQFFPEIEKRINSGEQIPSVSLYIVKNRNYGRCNLSTLKIENNPTGIKFMERLKNAGHVFKPYGRNKNRKQFVNVIYQSLIHGQIDVVRENAIKKKIARSLRGNVKPMFSTHFILFPTKKSVIF